MASRVLLVHWNRAEARERATRLRDAGYVVVIHHAQGGEGLRAHRDAPPAAIVIDLGRLPSHGRECGIWFRQQRGTRHVPLIFVDGAEEKVTRVRERLPDATYTSWPRIRGALRRAIASGPPADPVVPASPHFEGKTPLVKKLGIRPGTVLTLLGAPSDFEATLGELPEGVTVRRQARGRAERVILFARSLADLVERFPAAARAMADGGGIWIAWPKRASGVPTDVTQADVRRFGLDAGFVDYKIAAIDATWSGLLFARRD